MFRSPRLYIFVYIHEAHTRCRFHSVLHTSHRARTILFEGHWWLDRFRDLVFCSSFLIECAVYNLDMKCNNILLRYFNLYKKLFNSSWLVWLIIFTSAMKKAPVCARYCTRAPTTPSSKAHVRIHARVSTIDPVVCWSNSTRAAVAAVFCIKIQLLFLHTSKVKISK